jgi:lipopolysaccharide/colanic/teichoic acid biosynthesis glycosyltransferase
MYEKTAARFGPSWPRLSLSSAEDLSKHLFALSGAPFLGLSQAGGIATRASETGERATMSTLTHSPLALLGLVQLEHASILTGKGDSRSSRARRTAWVTAESRAPAIKRAVDLVGALAGLLLLMPVMLLTAVLIRLDSRGPVLFCQWRRGQGGRPFRMLKFRTMVVDAEQRLGELEPCNESAGGVLFKLRQDPRVTRLGRIMRLSSLDELPQLINVLKGEMSLVGPRPLQFRDSDRLRSVDPQGYRRRLEVLPGLTGPWQVGGRSELDYEQMVKLDVDYATNWSLVRDLGIIARTVSAVLHRRGAC